ncbi:M23 family metallopeptidase [Candidatus Liberibacter brunswickensis]|uniref:M23 family metallopeptidase n=1 Tax=Candidatus Liberibacter brunswickensis TaxID=1968796 RepID=UPI002FE18179
MTLYSTSDKRNILFSFGDSPTILGNQDEKVFIDKREVSFRWLSITFFAGITSGIIIGGSLLTSLDGNQKIAIPSRLSVQSLDTNSNNLNAILSSMQRERLSHYKKSKYPEKTIIDVPTLIKSFDKDIIKKIPFVYAKMNFSIPYPNVKDYPKFDPLKIFSEGKTESSSQMLMDTMNNVETLYGTESKLEVTIKKTNFPIDIDHLKSDHNAKEDEIKNAIINQTTILNNEKNKLFTLYYSGSDQSSRKEHENSISHSTKIKIIEENRTITTPKILLDKTPEFADDLIPIQHNTTIFDAMIHAGYSNSDSSKIAKALNNKVHIDRLTKDNILRIGIIQKNDKFIIIRFSIYHKKEHLLTIALNDNNEYVLGVEPTKIDMSNQISEIQNSNELPSIYDGIWRATSFNGMNKNLVQLVLRILASSVNLQAHLKPTDFLETFFSANPINNQISNESELLYIHARFGENRTRFYRYQDPVDGSVEYFNEQGKSSRPFLLRNPVPSGRMTSGFGIRHHPILGYSRMHTGIDWAAPRGTPIIAVSDGIVEKVGWAGGYGKQTIIRHRNKYVSSYNHQDAIAKNIHAGTVVKQGQIIGWIGTTGLSTGPHLHYELIVNGIKVDSMKIRIPEGKTLEGNALQRFIMETKRINSILKNK